MSDYQQISAKEIKKLGKIINKERHLPEGLYTTFNPLLDYKIRKPENTK